MRVRRGFVIGLAAAVAAAGGAGVATGGAHRSQAADVGSGPGCASAGLGLGRVAFATADGALRILDLDRCSTRTLVDHGANRAAFSHDGRWVAFDPGEIVAAHGGPTGRPLGRHIFDSRWSPTSDLLAGITRGRGVVAGSVEGGRRRLLPDGFGANSLAFSPSGRWLAVGASCTGKGRHYVRGKITLVNVRSGSRRRLTGGRPLRKPLYVEGYSPDGRWVLFWPDFQCSASLAADGMPLEAVPVRGGHPGRGVARMLLERDFISWCGSRAVIAAGPIRDATDDKHLVAANPPRWRRTALTRGQRLSWISPTCSPDGRSIAAAATGNRSEARFGLEHRSVWVMDADGSHRQRIARPGSAATSDEAPRFSRDGASILFVRGHAIYGHAPREHVTLELGRPIGGSWQIAPVAHFLSRDVGGYYGSYDWPTLIDWHQPGGPAPSG
jgi:hypothetical protein